jgi:hypothetical protein
MPRSHHPFLPLSLWGDRRQRLHYWLPTPLGAHLLRDAVLGLYLVPYVSSSTMRAQRSVGRITQLQYLLPRFVVWPLRLNS